MIDGSVTQRFCLTLSVAKCVKQMRYLSRSNLLVRLILLRNEGKSHQDSSSDCRQTVCIARRTGI